jgi:hypothetical protein
MAGAPCLLISATKARSSAGSLSVAADLDLAEPAGPNGSGFERVAPFDFAKAREVGVGGEEDAVVLHGEGGEMGV